MIIFFALKNLLHNVQVATYLRIFVIVAATAKLQETVWCDKFSWNATFYAQPSFPLTFTTLACLYCKVKPRDYSVLLIRDMMTGTAQLFSVAIDVAVICGFVAIMGPLQACLYQRTSTNPSN